MEKIKYQKHTGKMLYYSLSKMFERASFYGFRTLIVLYMIDETLNMETSEALSIYGWVAALLVIFQIIGALIGDLLIGNRKSVIIGGIFQAIGAFVLCIPSQIGLFLGLLLVALGNGIFMPNLTANFGKLYLNKTKLLDSAFTTFYLSANLGSFFGILVIAYLGETYGYTIGFMASGILMICSTLLIILSKEKKLQSIEKREFPINKRILNITISFIVVGLFWGFYEIASFHTLNLQLQLIEIEAFDIPKQLWQSIHAVFILPISIIAIVLWTYFYSSQYFKLILGFIFGIVAFAILLVIPEVPTQQHAIIYLTSLLFLDIAEIHIVPIINSILTQYSNPKYLAIIISLAFLPTKIISLFFGLFHNQLNEYPLLGIYFALIGMTVIVIGLTVYVNINKKPTALTNL